ncbi:MAG: IreB family regulatory phosphoprotein [Firmicutes bacterium]|nr:IreB family regulatory phosphoprotein [Bacillota bacterium]
MVGDQFNHTMRFNVRTEEEVNEARLVLKNVYTALQEKGYNPINQLVGYLLSGDPAFITSHNNARSIIRRLERDELLEELLRVYLEKELQGDR